MRNFRIKYPVLASMIVLVAALLATGLAMLLLGVIAGLRPETIYANEYRLQLVVELVWMLIMVFLTVGFGMERVFFEPREGFLDSLKPAAALIVLYALALLGELAMSVGMQVRPPQDMVYFVLCMAFVGLTEELTFRGLMVGMIYEKYGTSPAGIWFTVLSSSLVFGAMHLTNIAAAPASGVLAQAGAAAIMGTTLSAIYLRTGNLWAMAAIHGFMDFCALISTGAFYGGGFDELIGAYSLENVLTSLIYLALTVFLLRPKKLRQVLLPGVPAHRVRGKLAASIGILAALMILVMVLISI